PEKMFVTHIAAENAREGSPCARMGKLREGTILGLLIVVGSDAHERAREGASHIFLAHDRDDDAAFSPILNHEVHDDVARIFAKLLADRRKGHSLIGFERWGDDRR